MDLAAGFFEKYDAMPREGAVADAADAVSAVLFPGGLSTSIWSGGVCIPYLPSGGLKDVCVVENHAV